MSGQRISYEKQVLGSFEELAHKYGYEVHQGQGRSNRIEVTGNLYFQFGDLRVDTEKAHIVVEAESAGGITNLVKYWYCLEQELLSARLVLLHLFRQQSASDYGAHLSLWDFTWAEMKRALGDRMDATRYTYRGLGDLAEALADFEHHLKPNDSV